MTAMTALTTCSCSYLRRHGRRSVVIPPVPTGVPSVRRVLDGLSLAKDVASGGNTLMSVLAPSAAIRDARATAAMVVSMANAQSAKGQLRDQEKGLVELFVNDALNLASRAEVWVEEGGEEEALAAAAAAAAAATEAGRSRATAPASLSSLSSSLFSSLAGVAQSVSEATATATKPGLMVLDTSVKTLTGFDTLTVELSKHKQQLTWLCNVLSAHAVSEDDATLNELLVANARPAGLLTTAVTASPRQFSLKGLAPLTVRWDTKWPEDRIGHFDLVMVGRPRGLERRVVIAAGLDRRQREYEWRPPPVLPPELADLSTSRVASSLGFSTWLEVEIDSAGAALKEDGGIPAAQSRTLTLVV